VNPNPTSRRPARRGRAALLATTLLALLGGVATAILFAPGAAIGQTPSSSASFVGSDSGSGLLETHMWMNPATGNMTATIAAGGTVTFSYPTGNSEHNVVFTSSQLPTSCTVNGASAGQGPLPAQPTAPGWSGSCTFDTPGTYTFLCALHPNMTGTITVTAASTTPTTPPATTTAPPTMTTPMTSTLPLAAHLLDVPSHQSTTTIHGSVDIEMRHSVLTATVYSGHGARGAGPVITRHVGLGKYHFAAPVPRSSSHTFVLTVVVTAPGARTYTSSKTVTLSS
jgi:plastocyanin